MKRLFLLASIVLPIAICPTQAQYPTVPDSVKQRAAQENAIHHKLSEAAWKKALKTVKKEEKKYGRVYRPWASKPERFLPTMSDTRISGCRRRRCFLPPEVEEKSSRLHRSKIEVRELEISV